MSDIGALIEKLIRIRDSSDMSCEERDQLADAYSVLAVYKKFHRIPTEETVPDASSDLENLLVDCAQLINVIKQEWEQVGGWSHWDQSVLNRITLALVNLSAPAQEGMREALWAARVFIEDEYRDPSLEPEGEWLAKEARAIHSKICNALSAPAEPAGQTERLKTIVRDLTKFITSLTRGGSEYLIRFSDDLYYADLEMCAPYIRNRITETHEMKKQLARASKAEPAGRELLEEARDALETAESWLTGWASADAYLEKIRAALSKLRTALGEGRK